MSEPMEKKQTLEKLAAIADRIANALESSTSESKDPMVDFMKTLDANPAYLIAVIIQAGNSDPDATLFRKWAATWRGMALDISNSKKQGETQ